MGAERDRAGLERMREALEWFDHLLDLPEDQRPSRIGELEGRDPELAAQVRKLLDADAAAGDFLEGAAPLAGPGDPAEVFEGARLGAYRLNRCIGEGGMGEVWLAERADGQFQGRVALKLLHAHLNRPELRARFLREVQLLGRLSHPGIARLLDAGATPAGRLYFTLDYVEGERIDVWCDERRLDLGARLRLFLQVCEAVAHAHAHLVVHRDLKPSNILVDSDGKVRLLDFGIARALEGGRETATETQIEITRIGMRVLTPHYAAPEQLLGLPATTATDVYGLGLLLFKLLSGRLPFGEQGQSLPQVERAVLEGDPAPPSESIRHGYGNRVPELVRISSVRGLSSPRQLRHALRGDLDAICSKALFKEPSARYPTVAALAEEIERHLRHEPLRWSGAGRWQRVVKFVRRHRAGTAAAVAISLSLTVGLSAVIWQSERARENADRAERVKDLLVEVLQSVSPEEGGGPTLPAIELLRRGEERLSQRLAQDPTVMVDLYQALAGVHAALGDFERSETLSRRSAELLEQLDPDDPRVAVALHGQGYARLQRREAEPALALLEQALARHEQSPGQDRPGHAAVLRDLGHALAALSRREEAVQIQQKSLALITKHFGPEHPERGEALIALATRLEDAGRYDPAIKTYQQGIQVLEAVKGADHPRVAIARVQHAGLLDRLGQTDDAALEFDAAIQVLRHHYGEAHPLLARALFSRGLLRIGQRRYPEADQDLRESLKIHPPASYYSAQSRRYLGLSLLGQSRYSEAAAELEQAISEFASSQPNDPQQFRAQAELATVHLRVGRPELAEPMLRSAVQRIGELLGPASYEIRNPLKRLGEALLELKRPEEASEIFQRVLDLENQLLGDPSHRDLFVTRILLVDALLQQAQTDRAEQVVGEGLRVVPADTDTEELARFWVTAVRTAAASGQSAALQARLPEAHRRLDQALARAVTDRRELSMASLHRDRARLHLLSQDLSAALNSFREAESILRRSFPQHPLIQAIRQERLPLLPRDAR